MKLLKKFLESSGKQEILRMMAHGASDVGKMRSVNEDYFWVNPTKNLYIVADGMGGHNAGEVASQNATKLVDAYLTPEVIEEIRGDIRKVRETIINSLLHAHTNICEMADSNPEYEGMGCTIVTALIIGNYLHLCHVGDARAYLCDETGITLLTIDHSFVMELVQKGKLTLEEARVSPMKNKLNQAIGASRPINPDYKHYTLKEGDKILLCSDGLWDMLSDEQLSTVLKEDKPPQVLCETLIKMANDAGGHDNITALVILHKEQTDSESESESESRSEPLEPRAQETDEPDIMEKSGEYSFVFTEPDSEKAG